MGNVVATWKSDDADMVRSLQRLQQENEKLRQGIQRGGQESRAAGDQMTKSLQGGISAARELAGALGSGLGVTGIMAGVIHSFEIWNKQVVELSANARKGAQDVLSFAALQQPGAKGAAMQQGALAAFSAGVPQAEAFNAIQAMQSVLGGDLQKGMVAAKEIFAASKAGIPVPLGTEAEIMGISMGAEPGSTVRRAFVAGQMSGRTPEALVKAGQGVGSFSDPNLGFAVAAQLSSSFREEELRTAVMKVGQVLAAPTPELQKAFGRAGLGTASQMERMQALAQRGITSEEALLKFGISDELQRRALHFLLPNAAQVGQIQAGILQQATPGLFQRQRAAIEDDPIVGSIYRGERELSMIESQLEATKAFGPGREAELKELKAQKIRGLAFRRAGIHRVGPLDPLADDRIDDFEMAKIEALSPTLGAEFNFKLQQAKAEETRITKELEESNKTLKEIAESLKRGSDRRPATRVSEE